MPRKDHTCMFCKEIFTEYTNESNFHFEHRKACGEAKELEARLRSPAPKGPEQQTEQSPIRGKTPPNRDLTCIYCRETFTKYTNYSDFRDEHQTACGVATKLPTPPRNLGLIPMPETKKQPLHNYGPTPMPGPTPMFGSTRYFDPQPYVFGQPPAFGQSPMFGAAFQPPAAGTINSGVPCYSFGRPADAFDGVTAIPRTSMARSFHSGGAVLPYNQVPRFPARTMEETAKDRLFPARVIANPPSPLQSATLAKPGDGIGGSQTCMFCKIDFSKSLGVFVENHIFNCPGNIPGPSVCRNCSREFPSILLRSIHERGKLCTGKQSNPPEAGSQSPEICSTSVSAAPVISNPTGHGNHTSIQPISPEPDMASQSKNVKEPSFKVASREEPLEEDIPLAKVEVVASGENMTPKASVAKPDATTKERTASALIHQPDVVPHNGTLAFPQEVSAISKMQNPSPHALAATPDRAVIPFPVRCNADHAQTIESTLNEASQRVATMVEQYRELSKPKNCRLQASTLEGPFPDDQNLCKPKSNCPFCMKFKQLVYDRFVYHSRVLHDDRIRFYTSTNGKSGHYVILRPHVDGQGKPINFDHPKDCKFLAGSWERSLPGARLLDGFVEQCELGSDCHVCKDIDQLLEDQMSELAQEYVNKKEALEEKHAEELACVKGDAAKELDDALAQLEKKQSKELYQAMRQIQDLKKARATTQAEKNRDNDLAQAEEKRENILTLAKQEPEDTLAQTEKIPPEDTTRMEEDHESALAKLTEEHKQVLTKEKDAHAEKLEQTSRHPHDLKVAWADSMRSKVQMETKLIAALARVEEAREEARYKKLKTEALAQAKKHQQKELLSHVKRALHERHERELQQVKEEYKTNARALVEKEHRAEIETIIQDALTSTHQHQQRHDLEIAQLLAQHQNLLLADGAKAQKRQERDADLARIAQLKENLGTVIDENRKLVDMIGERTRRLEELRKRQVELRRRELGEFFVERKRNGRRR